GAAGRADGRRPAEAAVVRADVASRGEAQVAGPGPGAWDGAARGRGPGGAAGELMNVEAPWREPGGFLSVSVGVVSRPPRWRGSSEGGLNHASRQSRLQTRADHRPPGIYAAAHRRGIV